MVINQFEISFSTNEIIALSPEGTKVRTKVEPRIMQVLEILVKNSPEVVSREQLIAEVWNHYGGADDALNQAISHLRKILKDTDRENRIIETVVKKGYRIEKITPQTPLPPKPSATEEGITLSRNTILALFLVFLAVLLFSLNYQTSSNDNSLTAPKAPLNAPDTLNNTDALAPVVKEDIKE